MKLFLSTLILAVTTASSAFARPDALVVFQKPEAGRPGIADVLASSELKNSTVTITTRLGIVIPVRFYSRLNATILDAYLKSGYSVDVTDCSELDHAIAHSTAYDGECTRTTYAVRFRCGLFDTATTFHGAEARDYVMQDVAAHPLETERLSCHAQHGNKF